MSRARRALGLLLPLVAGLGASACIEFAGDGARDEGLRLISGEVRLDDGVIGRQITGLQMAAIAVREVDGEPRSDVYTSEVFDTGYRGTPFVVAADQTRAVNLILQVPGSSQQGAGSYLGAYFFDDGFGGETSLIPAGKDDIDIGELLAVENDSTNAADNTLQGDSGQNPLSQIDSDDDGVVDLSDTDDDDDGVEDASDEDVAGDGTVDARQGLSVLPDADNDGVPDELQ